MLVFLDKEIAGKLSFWGYRYRFLCGYILIGVTSIALEILCYFGLERVGLHPPTSNLLGLAAGVFFAYWMNVRFNFRIPRGRRNRAFLFFMLISFVSVMVNFAFKRQLEVMGWSYGSARFVVAGSLFLCGYVLHRRYSFSDYMKVGVAIYTTRQEDIVGIHDKIGVCPDFIHVDVVDDTIVEGSEAPTIHRLEVIKAYWPKKPIHIHLMSKQPLRWIDELAPFADVLFVQGQMTDDIGEVLSVIQKHGKKSGLCVTLDTSLDNIKPYLEKVHAVMVLAILKAGYSGQRFEMEALEYIKTLREWQTKWGFQLCVDGGVNEKNIGLLNVEYVVSGSSILEHTQPHRQIMRLRTQSRYEELEHIMELDSVGNRRRVKDGVQV